MRTLKHISLAFGLLILFSVANAAQSGIEAKIESAEPFFMLESRVTKKLPTSLVLNNLLKKRTDGTTGYYLKEVGRPPQLARNKNFIFYPASSIKVFQHLHAIRSIQLGSAHLTDMISYNGGEESLQVLLRKMMINSENRASNVIQDHFTRASINSTVHTYAGVSNDSALAHHFGANGPNSNPMNRMTLKDVGSLYESVITGQSLNGAGQQMFYENMSNGSSALTLIDGAINREGTDLGMTEQQIARFRNAIWMVQKSGWIPDSYDGNFYESVAGSVEMPLIPRLVIKKSRLVTTSEVAYTRGKRYVFGYFVNKADSIDNTPTSLKRQVISEMFRQPIREALQIWLQNPDLQTY